MTFSPFSTRQNDRQSNVEGEIVRSIFGKAPGAISSVGSERYDRVGMKMRKRRLENVKFQMTHSHLNDGANHLVFQTRSCLIARHAIFSISCFVLER